MDRDNGLVLLAERKPVIGERFGVHQLVVRAYLGIAPHTVWSILSEDIPALEFVLRVLLDVFRARGS